MKIARFKATHLAELRLQAAQSYMVSTVLSDGYGAALEQVGGFTAFADDGRVIACAGCAERWPGSAMAWALVSCDAGKNMVGVVKAIRGYLEHAGQWRRIEAAVDVGFEAGERMMRLLGFEREGLARAYRPDGGDCTIWARIRPVKEA